MEGTEGLRRKRTKVLIGELCPQRPAALTFEDYAGNCVAKLKSPAFYHQNFYLQTHIMAPVTCVSIKSSHINEDFHT